jgi:hypothetical protein
VGDHPIKRRVLYEKDFGWMAFWELNPEVLGSLWLMTLRLRGGGITLAEALPDSGRRAVSLLNYTLGFALQLRISTENLTHFSRIVKDYSLHRLGCFSRTPSAGLLSIGLPRFTRVGRQSASVGTSAFQVSEMRSSPHQLTLS